MHPPGWSYWIPAGLGARPRLRLSPLLWVLAVEPHVRGARRLHTEGYPTWNTSIGPAQQVLLNGLSGLLVAFWGVDSGRRAVHRDIGNVAVQFCGGDLSFIDLIALVSRVRLPFKTASSRTSGVRAKWLC